MTHDFSSFLEKHLTFWDHLSETQKGSLIQASKMENYETGQTLHSNDMDCIGLLIVKSGMLRIYITSEEGRQITLYRLEEGEICILSASCVLKTITFDVSIEAEMPCEVLQINSFSFSKITDQNIYAELFSYQLATERFSDVMWAMQQILFKSFDRRLATFLIDESIKEKNDTIHMTHEQIAKYLGSAREVVSRMLKYFSTEGYVSLSRGDITLTNKSKLKSLALS